MPGVAGTDAPTEAESHDATDSAGGGPVTTVGSPAGRLAPLDGMRTVFVAIVMAHHLVWAAPDRVHGWVPGAWAGLDGFFVLSGFLIGGGLLRQLAGSGRIGLRSFVTRRLIRLYPAMALALAAMAAVAVFVDGRTWAATFPSVRAGALYVMNRKFGHHDIDLFGRNPQAPIPEFTHLWSLSVEFQFYLAIAVLLIVLHRLRVRPPAMAAVVAVVMATASWHRSRVWRAEPFPAAYVFTEARVDTLLWGVLVGIAVHQGWLTVRHRVALRVLAVPALTALVWMMAVQEPRSDLVYDWLMPLSGLTNAVLLAWVLLDGPNLVTRVLGSKVLVGLGQRSYSLYLYHYPVYFFVGAHLSSFGPWARIAMALAISVVLADVSFRLVERPVLERWGRRRAGAAGR